MAPTSKLVGVATSLKFLALNEDHGGDITKSCDTVVRNRATLQILNPLLVVLLGEWPTREIALFISLLGGTITRRTFYNKQYP